VKFAGTAQLVVMETGCIPAAGSPTTTGAAAVSEFATTESDSTLAINITLAEPDWSGGRRIWPHANTASAASKSATPTRQIFHRVPAIHAT
jgi:hypothetical protein